MNLEGVYNHGFSDRELEQTFDTYVVYDPRQVPVVECCKTFPKYRWLVLLGGCGSGKDHLASATTRLMVERGDHARVKSGTAQKLMRDYRDTAFNSQHDHPEGLAFEKLATAGLLLIRDAGIRMTDAERNTWIEVLNYRYDERKTTIITSNTAPREFSQVFDERVTDRIFEMGWQHNGQPFVLCDWPSYRRQPTEVACTKSS